MRIGLQGPINHVGNGLYIQYKYFYFVIQAQACLPRRSTACERQIMHIRVIRRNAGVWPPAGVQLARPARRGWGLRPPGICRAQQETRGKSKHGAFGFRFSWSRGHARQNLWPYIRRDVTHSGGLKSLQRTEARGASANSMRSVRASISWQSGLLLQWLLSQPPSQKRLRGHLGHATILLDLQHSLPSGGLSRVKRAVTSLAGKTDQNCTETQKITDTNNR
jgi:hypothetical protein